MLLCRLLPTYCNEHLTVKTVDDELKKAGQSAYGEFLSLSMCTHFPVISMLTGMLSFPMWMLAWDAYSLAAPMVEQFSFQAGIKHKHEIAQVANDYGEKVAVMYDRLVR